MGCNNCEESAIAEVARKSGAGASQACVCDRLAGCPDSGGALSGIVSRRNKLLSSFNDQDAHQVGHTFLSTEFALANALVRYLILLSRQGKVVRAACELDRGRS